MITFTVEIELKEKVDEFVFDTFLRELFKNDKRVEQFTLDYLET